MEINSRYRKSWSFGRRASLHEHKKPRITETKIDTCYGCSKNWTIEMYFVFPNHPPESSICTKQCYHSVCTVRIVAKNWKWRRIAPGRSVPVLQLLPFAIYISMYIFFFSVFLLRLPLLHFPISALHNFPSSITAFLYSFIIPRYNCHCIFFPTFSSAIPFERRSSLSSYFISKSYLRLL